MQLFRRTGTVDGQRAGRMLTATVATSAPTLVFDLLAGRVITEVLVMAGGEFPESLPLLTDHSRAVPSMVGSAQQFRVEAERVSATLVFADDHTGADDAWQLASQRHLRSVSLGYQALEAVDVSPGRSVVVAGRTYTAPANRPLRVTTRWIAKEVSLVPVGADAGATIRSSPEGFDMLNSIGPALPYMTFPEMFKTLLRSERLAVPENGPDLVRAALSHVSGVSALQNIVNAAVLAGYHSAADSTVGWVRTAPLPNFLPAQVAYNEIPLRFNLMTRGGTAATVHFGLSSATGWRLARFACHFALDEQDLVDDLNIGLFQTAIAEVGAAARRIIPDLVYSLLLSNEALPDTVALFHGSRGNLSSGALSSTTLDAGFAAIASQQLTDQEGDPIHVNLRPRYLVVPPANWGVANRVSALLPPGEQFIVRSESRLTSAGVVDPRDDQTILQGNGANWLMAAAEEQAAGVVVGLLDGRAQPTLRSYELNQGQWGMGFDVLFDCGVCAIDGRPLYWSTGQ